MSRAGAIVGALCVFTVIAFLAACVAFTLFPADTLAAAMTAGVVSIAILGGLNYLLGDDDE
jgi:hypothetical protein